MFAGWLVSLRLRDASIVDPLWGLSYVAVAWMLLAWGDEASTAARTWLMLAMVTVWGLRLGVHLTARKWGEPEDYRYAAMRGRRPRAFTWWSLVMVFGLQGALIVVVSLPVQAVVGASGGPSALGPLDWLGCAVWAVGLAFETTGDEQLRRFKSDPANRGAVLQRGLWRYTRHPNYFGDFCVWWGSYLVAASAGGAWTIAGPLVMSILLLRVSGVAMLESTITDRRPGYADYVRRTSAFVPLPPRRPGGPPEGGAS
ncbi:MAG: DUF1295 domain-containing protein [Acidimicrobiia bacterium]|nr:DUF1295 domain-containing protein [Acidimicrobiia bacterium]MYB24619.1 DUF1295 domain-containing protein [Acidimicrobiia bacterium]